MNLKRMSKTTVALLLVIAVLSSAFAVVMYTRTVPNTATIKAVWGISLWKMDGSYQNPVEQINSITWGDLDPGTEFTTNQLYGTCLKVKNNGNAEVHVAWKLDPTTPLPSGVALTARYCFGADWWDLTQNDYATITIQSGQFSGDLANPNSGRVEFKLTIGQYAVPVTFSFNILLNAADSSTG